MSIAKSKYKAKFSSYVFGTFASRKVIDAHLVIYNAKNILNCFVCMEVRILVEKRNVYKPHIFRGD